ncbi:hypothetical protein [Pseudobdellovibrio sp. HCB154]|uniref:hypothetical protein n=1 Tax=Pseudobdellovibrio sp. HCB154 TaxID=3386277 RepID=UPI003917172C
MGHTQLHFTKTRWQFRYNHGGILRQKRRGRKARPLSTKAPIHLVLKTDIRSLCRGLRSPLGFYLINYIIKTYARRFFVKVEQVSINHDHVHLLVRFSRRSLGQHFLRVVTGQIAQQFKNNGFLAAAKSVTDTPATKPRKSAKLWKYRPFTRVIQGWKPYLIVRNYIQLNIKEASGQIKYKPRRLRGLSLAEWQILWT